MVKCRRRRCLIFYGGNVVGNQQVHIEDKTISSKKPYYTEHLSYIHSPGRSNQALTVQYFFISSLNRVCYIGILDSKILYGSNVIYKSIECLEILFWNFSLN